MTPTPTRRAVLRAAGVTLTLPVLESLGLAADEKPAGPRGRLVCVYKAHGVCNEAWYPKEFGPRLPKTPSLEPLDDLRDRVTLLSGLSHLRCPEGFGHSGVDVFLTGGDPRQPRKVSLDQVAAEALRGTTRFPSLQLGTRSGTGSAQAAFTLSFNQQGIGLPSENDPRRVFQRLFVGDGASARAAQEQRLRDRRSILDAVLDQSRTLAGDLDANDRRKLDEYQHSVREVEQQIRQGQDWLDRPRPKVATDAVALDVVLGQSKTEFLRTMYGLAALALQTDSTRVITLVTSPEGANADPWPEAGLTATHHNLQHHNGMAGALAKLAEIDRVEVGLLAGFLRKLAALDDGDAPLLDRTLVLYGSGLNNGTNDYRNGMGSHGTRKLPVLVAGGSRLGLKQGQHLDFPGDRTPLCNLFVTLLQAMGLPRDSFEDGTGRLNGLT